MKKKIVKIMVLTGVIALTASLALIIMPMMPAWGSSAETYSLDEAVAKAMDSNHDLDALSQNINSAAERYRNASGDLDKRKKSRELSDLEYERDEKKKEITLDITSLYYQILFNKQNVNIQEGQVERLKKENEQQEKKVELGNEPDSSLLSYKVAIAEGEEKLTSLKNQGKKLVMDMNIKMGIDVGQNLILKDREALEETISIKDINGLAEKLVLASPEVDSLEEGIAITEEELDMSNVGSRQDIEDKLEKLKYDLRDKKDEIRYKARTDYNSILNFKDTVNVKELDHQKYIKLEEIAKLKYDLGLITLLENEKASEDADNAFLAYQQARLDYYLAVKRYKNFIEPAQ